MSTFSTNQGLTLPVDADANDVPGNFSLYNAGVENRLVQRYESAVDRSVRNPNPDKGEISYLADTDVHERYDGAQWRNLRGGTDHFFLPGETGTVNLTFSNQSAFTVGVAFVTPFVVAPLVLTNISITAAATAGFISRAYNISTTGFTMYVAQVNNVTASWSAVPVDWVAIGRQ